MARPKRNYAIEVVGIKLTLVIGEDDDLIGLLRSTPLGLRAITIKSALRGQLQTGDASVGMAIPDISEELDGFVL